MPFIPSGIFYRRSLTLTLTLALYLGTFFNRLTTLMGRNEKRNRAILKDFLSSPRVIIVEMDKETSERYAVIVQSLRIKGTPIPTNDPWIATSAMQHGLKVLNTDKHYQEIPQIITEYSEAE